MMMQSYRSRLEELKRIGLLRELTLGRPGLLDFSSNDYLGLSDHPAVVEGSIEAIRTNGCSSSASRLMSGNIRLHIDLERKLALLTGMESCLLFGSGFLANIGVLNAMTGRDDVIFADRLNHASLVDGALLSRASVRRYRHCDIDHLRELIRGTRCTGRRFIVTDTLFSMDGDVAPLGELQEIAREHECGLVVDEAHAVGVFGDGSGLCMEMGVRPDLIVGTLSKALGSYGGFAACSGELREYLINRSRSFIYSTGLPPSSCGAALASIAVIRENPGMGKRLLDKASDFRMMLRSHGFSTGRSSSQIVPLITGETNRAVAIASHLLDWGVRAVAIRPPTVPSNTSRIRLSITRMHTSRDLSRLAEMLSQLKALVF